MDGEVNPAEGNRPAITELKSIKCVLAYHHQTKHHLHRFAASPVYIEGYVILPEMAGLNADIYHYISREHCLERAVF